MAKDRDAEGTQIPHSKIRFRNLGLMTIEAAQLPLIAAVDCVKAGAGEFPIDGALSREDARATGQTLEPPFALEFFLLWPVRTQN
jgi:hypothetical protein